MPYKQEAILKDTIIQIL